MWMAVEGGREPQKFPRTDQEAAGQPNANFCRVDRQEKLSVELYDCPYRKPTQVGEASSLR